MPWIRLVAVMLLAAAALAGTMLALITQPLVTPLTSQPPAADPARLEAHVRELSVGFYPRSADRPLKSELCAEYIEAQLRLAGGTVSTQEFMVQADRHRNIVARFGPPQGPLLVIGAHYDSHGDTLLGARERLGYSPESHTPGADDNASGVAALLELARLLGQRGPARPVELVAYATEEPPHFRTPDMGSARHAQALLEAGQDVQLMLSLEMVGYFSDIPGSQGYPFPGMTWLYPDRGDFIAVVGRLGDFGTTRRVKALMAGASALPVRSINAPRLVPGIDFSDHLNYWNRSMPALMVTDTSFHRNPHYHQATDTAEKLDYRRMAQVVQAVHAVAQGL